MIIPRLIERHCGGWLAVSPEGCSVRIGVTGDAPEQAIAAFEVAMSQWRRILGMRPAPPEGEAQRA